MRTVEILDKIPGLKRDQLQYWQKRGFICAEKFIRGKRLVSDYPKNELKKIELMFEYVNSVIHRLLHMLSRQKTFEVGFPVPVLPTKAMVLS